MGSVLNTSFFLPFGLRGVTRAAAEAAFVQDLVCYETVWILTDQMAAVGMLLGIMGPDAVIEALDRRALRFIRDRYIIGWPQRPKYGATPVVNVAGLRGAGGEPTFTTSRHGDLAVAAIRGFGLPYATEQRIGQLVEDATIDFDYPPKSVVDRATDLQRTRAELEAYRRAVAKMPGFPVTDAHLKRLIRDIGKPKKQLLLPSRIGVVYTAMQSGQPLLAATAPLDAAQLGMVQLSLGDRFLRALLAIEADGVLHTDSTVEVILRARVATVRHAVADEVEDVLRAENVSLPVLVSTDALRYIKLLDARESRASAAFRRIVDRRDGEGTRALLPEYMAALADAVGQRWTAKIVRWLGALAISKVAGGGLPLDLALFATDHVVDQLLKRLDARFYIDTTLRRIADPSGIKIEVVTD